MVVAAKPARTNSANWSAVNPCMRMTGSVHPPEPQPARSASARRSGKYKAKAALVGVHSDPHSKGAATKGCPFERESMALNR
jgi:hypothetical protein